MTLQIAFANYALSKTRIL